ncbi:hypothetical protein BDN71DRAFT_1454970, partial [Pleurotus eryngii]
DVGYYTLHCALTNPEQNNLDVPSYRPAKITIPPQPTPASRSSILSIHSPFLYATARESPFPNPQTHPACCKCRRIADDTVDAHTGMSYGSTQLSSTALSASPQTLQVVQCDLA